MNLRCIAIALLAVPTLLQADWKYTANKYDLRTATTTATGTSPDGPIQATLSIQYSPGKDGTMSIALIVSGADKMKGFGFDAFEGPDAPAASRKLTRIVVEKPGAKPLTLQTGVGGWYYEDGFHFSVSDTNKEPADVFKAVRAMQGGATKVSITVQDMKDAKKLHADFTTDGAADTLAKLLK